MLESLGFEHEGTLREALWYRGEYYDTLIYGQIGGRAIDIHPALKREAFSLLICSAQQRPLSRVGTLVHRDAQREREAVVAGRSVHPRRASEGSVLEGQRGNCRQGGCRRGER